MTVGTASGGANKATTGTPSGAERRPASLAAVIAYLADGEGALAVAELRALSTDAAPVLSPAEMRYWLGLAHLLAYDWSGAAHEFHRYVSGQDGGWRAGWAQLHMGRAFEQAGRTDEASLAYRGVLATEGAERAARKMAFDRMSRIANSLSIGYGQAPVREAQR